MSTWSASTDGGQAGTRDVDGGETALDQGATKTTARTAPTTLDLIFSDDMGTQLAGIGCAIQEVGAELGTNYAVDEIQSTVGEIASEVRDIGHTLEDIRATLVDIHLALLDR